MDFFHQWPFVKKLKTSIATIGNFDGMHLGHQAILKQLIALARQKKLAATVILFEPQPLEFFLKDKAPARLQRLSDKLIFLKKMGVDQAVCLSFNADLATIAPQQFIENILLDQLNIKALLVGQDFHFGKNRAGDVNLLMSYAKYLELTIIHDISCQGQQRISSTRVREALSQGNFEAARDLLGRPYTMRGRVIHGAKRGRKLQFPTANLSLLRSKSPLYGVYAVEAVLSSGLNVPGVANIGFRPTVHEQSAWYLEVHLLDHQSHDLYGQHLTVEFIQKIRDEKRFGSLEELQKQIGEDVNVAKHILFK